jgi:hypothetical protein
MEKNMEFFMQEDNSYKNEVVIAGIQKFKYPTDGEGYKKGDIIPWIVKPINTEKLSQLTESNTTTKRKKGKEFKTVDQKRLTYEVMVESIIYPNFKDKAWLEKYKLIDPVDLLTITLDLPGDFSRMSKEVLAIHGIDKDDDEEDLIEEAKN